MLNILVEALLLVTRVQPMTNPEAGRNRKPEQRFPTWQPIRRTPKA